MPPSRDAPRGELVVKRAGSSSVAAGCGRSRDRLPPRSRSVRDERDGVLLELGRERPTDPAEIASDPRLSPRTSRASGLVVKLLLLQGVCQVAALQERPEGSQRPSSTIRIQSGEPSVERPLTENKRTVEKYMAGFRATDHAAILSCLTDDVEWVIPGMFHSKGKGGFRSGNRERSLRGKARDHGNALGGRSRHRRGGRLGAHTTTRGRRAQPSVLRCLCDESGQGCAPDLVLDGDQVEDRSHLHR
jgi:hypothetical protein